MVRAVIVAGVALLSCVAARPTYPARLPNGADVPGVDALGHINPSGGGTNNQFGLDFATAGHEWTKDFCETDSDGDGQTNGQELGDPCCAWVESSNAVVLWTTGISHPGNASWTSDESLWADISCGSSSGSTGTAGSGSTTTAGSSSATGSSSTAATPTPTPTPTASGASAAGVSAAALAVTATAAAMFA